MCYVGFPVLARCVVLPASAVALALTGCASSVSAGSPAATSASRNTRENANPLALIKAANARTLAAKSARVFMKIDDPETDQGNYPVDGVDDFEHQRAEETYWDGQGTVETRQVGTDLYMHYVKQPAGVPGVLGTTKPWAKIPVADNDLPGGSSVIDGAEFGLLRYISSPVTVVDTGHVRGQRSTHYRVTVDKPIAGCGAKPTASPIMPLDIWLDSQGRLTRMQFRFVNNNQVPPGFPTPSPQQTPTTVVTTVELYDFGVPVSISAPPAGETQNVPLPPAPHAHSTSTPCPTS